MSRPIPSRDYVDHFDPELEGHRAWLQAALERLVDHEPEALMEGGPLWRLWSTEPAPVADSPVPAALPSPAAADPTTVPSVPRPAARMPAASPSKHTTI